MKLAPNAIYGLHLTSYDGTSYIHLFHSNERGQVDIAMYAENMIKRSNGMTIRFEPEFIKHDPNYSHNHWLIGYYDWHLVASHVVKTEKLTARDYRKMARKVAKHKPH